MTQANDMEDFSKGILYSRLVDVAELPDEIQEQAGSLDQLFAIYDAEGEQVALVASLDIAGDLAEANEMTLLSLH